MITENRRAELIKAGRRFNNTERVFWVEFMHVLGTIMDGAKTPEEHELIGWMQATRWFFEEIRSELRDEFYEAYGIDLMEELEKQLDEEGKEGAKWIERVDKEIGDNNE